MNTGPTRNRESGYALLAVGACLVGMIATLGLAVDAGRLYIVRNEIQAYTDSAALAAAMELDGTSGGISRAVSRVTNNTNRWNMGTTLFSGTQTEFASAAGGPWSR